MSASDIEKYTNPKLVLLVAIISALAFVVALFWNQAIQTTVTTFLPDTSAVWVQYLLAIFITLVLVAVAWTMSKLLLRSEHKKEQQAKEQKKAEESAQQTFCPPY